MKLNIKKLSENAKLPTYGSKEAAGLDLYANHSAKIKYGCTTKIDTGIAIAIPRGYVGLIFARSGLAAKQGLRPANCVGVIDSDYRGELIVALYNDSNQFREIQQGERIAQLVITPYLTVELQKVEELDETDRGSGGFGSTGAK